MGTLRPSTSETPLSVHEEEKNSIVHHLSKPRGVKKSLKSLPREVKKSTKPLLRGVRKAANNIKHYKTTADSKLFEFHLFADDANLFYEHKSLQQLQENINSGVINIHTWLCANKLSLNIEKSNFILFHSPQKKLKDSYFNLKLCNKQLKREYCIKYLGILIDSHLNWKKQVEFIGQKIKRVIGILCKLRHYVDLNILVKLYYALSFFNLWNSNLGKYL